MSASGGVVFPGTFTVEDTALDTKSGYRIGAAADFFVSPRISMGLLFERMGFDLEESGYGIAITTIGGTIVGRFGSPAQGHFRTGFGISYEIESTDAPGTDDADGLGLRIFAGYSHPMGETSAIFVQVAIAGSARTALPRRLRFAALPTHGARSRIRPSPSTARNRSGPAPGAVAHRRAREVTNGRARPRRAHPLRRARARTARGRRRRSTRGRRA